MLTAGTFHSAGDLVREDLEQLQDLLDRSYSTGGTHLQRVITPERRLTAVELVSRLEGMCLLTVATVTAAVAPGAFGIGTLSATVTGLSSNTRNAPGQVSADSTIANVRPA